ncbi:2-phosphosulfolactate phosphatase [Amycolatopsis sp. 195334CR]|uniref:2-phosphosulfolactate phosphatase n=1 Tax=Amycolatopsis sp. 195334CR TaxID=2814588 RepID=UPI001A8C1851|nr:2-phosphosulfolactate phosphatase [Amycolatopsis sp. 195334CR]MBN6037341.1 2-phosphosulfolactate phosphatase [Amycolatopsis sp. 195334CR]
MSIFGQPGHDIRLEWGEEGITALGAECAVLVVVDVLSFSTTVDIALSRGARVLPVRWRDERGIEAARAAGAIPAGEWEWSLRPASVLTIPAGTLLALPSPNGATLCAMAANAGTQVLTGCLRNARAVARMARVLAQGGPIGVVPAGERWGVDVLTDLGTTGTLRPSAEDLLGAGAIVDALITAGAQWPSAEASLAARAYRAAGPDVGAVVASSSSGKDLSQAGHMRDVDLAIAVNSSKMAPYLDEGVFVDVTPRR